MSDLINEKRRKFLKKSLIGGIGIAAVPVLAFSQAEESAYLKARQTSKNLSDKGPAADEEMVFEMVHKAHFNIQIVKELQAKEPSLVNASWDWGGGDFETPLGAASHTGNREIAEFLIATGARPNLFAATMLGRLDIVKGFLELDPNLKNCKGPHGLSLLHHAEKGKEKEKEIVKYLNSLS